MKRAMKYSSLFVCAILALILMSPMALALTRRTHLSNFIDSAKTPSGGYQSTKLPTNATEGTPDLASTAYAMNMSLFFGKVASDFIDTTSWILVLKTGSNGFRMSDSYTTATMEGMYLASSALNAGEKLSSLGNEVRTWITNRRNVTSGGFDTEEGGITTTIATYYAVESLHDLNNITIINGIQDSIKQYYLNCHNLDGGFAEIVGKESTLEGTWAAVAGLYRLGGLMDFSLSGAIDVPLTSRYVSQFYFSNESDTLNYGGYGISDRATVRDTFYVQKTLFLLGVANPNGTAVKEYLLSCQNPADGGFAEKSTNSAYSSSSMITTYFAFETLKTFDPQLEMLNVEVWFLPFDFVLLIIILAIVIVVIAAAVHYYRKRHE